MTRGRGLFGWCVLTGFVVAYDLMAEETLSASFRRHRHRPAVVLVWGSLTLHLFGLIPEVIDPYRQLHKRGRRPSSTPMQPSPHSAR